jgi:hypothetical protein
VLQLHGKSSAATQAANNTQAGGAPPLQGVQERLGRLPLRDRRRVQRLRQRRPVDVPTPGTGTRVQLVVGGDSLAR